MGGAVSAGEDNDELIDNLIGGNYIKTISVEKAFRAVDRGDYYLEGCRENAYRDLAWKHGLIHMSAPCIYSEVMESLKLGPGMSFLNLGSGTGYLSTMAGLLIGPYGTNHGVELHQSNVDYAREKLDEFQYLSPAMDKYEFCPPTFVVGNCLLLDASSVARYDRVYCGAQCPSEHENFMKNLIRVGGILVMPINDNLLQVIRTAETTFEERNVLPVSFASLVVPNVDTVPLLSVKLPDSYPQTLQELCRSAIRVILRKAVETENSSLTVKRIIKPKRKKEDNHEFRTLVVPFYEHFRDLQSPEYPPMNRRSNQRVSNNDEAELFAQVPDNNSLDEASDHQSPLSDNCQNICQDQSIPNSSQQMCNTEMVTFNNDNDKATELDMQMEQDQRLEKEDSISTWCGRHQTLTTNGDNVNSVDNVSGSTFPDHQSPLLPSNQYQVLALSKMSHQTFNNKVAVNDNDKGNVLDVEMEQDQRLENAERATSFHKSGRRRTLTANGDSGIDNISDDSFPEEYHSDSEKNDSNKPPRAHCTNNINLVEEPRNSGYRKRSAEENDEDDLSNHQSDENDRSYNGYSSNYKRVALSDPDSDELEEIDSDSESDELVPRYDEKNILSIYTYFMKQKINQLPIPHALKIFLNLSRPI